MNTNEFKNLLCNRISQNPNILGIAQTGDLNAPLIPGKSDIDLFVLCKSVPEREERLSTYARLEGSYDQISMEVCNCDTWGVGDIFDVNKIDVMPMYFEIDKFYSYIDEVLSGKYLHREGRFYPIGRLATVESINIIYEQDNAWSALIEKVKKHPDELFSKWYEAQSSQILDEEDLGRVILRKEVLFYHQVLEEALDHFLQALYALNNTYFPSRKRNAEAIEAFTNKPDNCNTRLLHIIETSVKAETIEDSVNELCALVEDLSALKI